MNEFEKRVLKTIVDNKLIISGDTVVVGFSGGKGEKHPDDGSETVPETSRLQAVGASYRCDGVPFA